MRKTSESAINYINFHSQQNGNFFVQFLSGVIILALRKVENYYQNLFAPQENAK